MPTSFDFSPRARRCASAGFLVLFATFALRAAPPTNRGYTLEFEDNFDSLDATTVTTPPFTNKWVFRAGGAADGYNHPENVSITAVAGIGNCLDVVGKKERDSHDYRYTCGGLISTAQCGYGYYEARLKVPPQKGWHCSFWAMQSKPPSTYGATNEIDGIEIDSDPTAPTGGFNLHLYQAYGGISDRPNHIGYGLQDPSNPAARRAGKALSPVPADGQFHVYAWDWQPNQIIWYVDNVEQARSSYSGPGAPNNIWLTNLAYNVPGRGIEDGGHLLVDYCRYWRRDYGGLAPTVAQTVDPVASTGVWSNSRLAYDDVAMSGAGDVKTTFTGGSTAKWDFPSALAAGGYEVYAWNPSLFPVNILSPDNPIDDNPGDGVADDRHLVSYAITHDGGTVTSPVVDQVYDGQVWVPLGAYTFTAGSGKGVSLTAPATPLIPTRAGPVAFRPLDLAYDDFSAGLSSGWTSVSGTWSVASGVLASTANAESILLRGPASWQNHLVRVRMLTGTATSLGVIGHYQDANNYYLLRIDPAGRMLGLLRRTSSGFVTLQSTAIPSGVSITGWTNLILAFDGDATTGVRLRGYVEGHELIQYVDTSAPLVSGTVGLRTYGGSVQFGNFGAGH